MDSFRNADEFNQSLQRQPEENSFSYLAAHPTVEGWKRRLYALIAGESSETLSRLGSIEQYIRVLLAQSKDRIAEYCFRDALSQTVQEWTPAFMEPADRLHSMLSLIAAFSPSVGFIKVLDYLNNTEDAKRTNEQVSDQPGTVDLYKKGLVALAQYYPAPPPHSATDFGFLSYQEILNKNLTDDRYAGYAAVKLLQLKVLDIKSEPFSTLFFASDTAASEVFRYLLDSAEEPSLRQAAQERLGDILVICAKADKLDTFTALAARHKSHFNPEGDYEIFYPTLTLSNGLALQIYLDMEEVKETALKYYVTYSTDKIARLIINSNEQDKLGKYVSAFITRQIAKTDSLDELVQELLKSNARIDFSKDEVVITVPGPNVSRNIPVKLDKKTQTVFLTWYFKSNYYREKTTRFVFPTTSVRAH